MTSRNISVTDDVYELLTKMKLKNESFSDTIRRLANAETSRNPRVPRETYPKRR